MTAAPADLSAYAGLDTCVISDAVDALGEPGRPRGVVLDGLHAVWAGARLFGRVVTMQMAAGPAPAGSVHLGVSAIRRAAPGDVILVDNGGRTDAGSWGGLLSLAAHAAGVAGVVTNGAARDVDEAWELEFPVFAAAATPRTARGRYHELTSGAPVEVQGARIETGDLVAADGTGVVIVFQDHITAVLERALVLARKEATMRTLLERGGDPAGVLDGRYEDMLTLLGDEPADDRSAAT